MHFEIFDHHRITNNKMPPYLRSAHPSKTVANVHIQGPPTKRKCGNDNNDNAKSDNDAPTISRWLTKRAKTEKVADSDDDSPSFAR
jgi:hypothetical protein